MSLVTFGLGSSSPGLATRGLGSYASSAVVTAHACLWMGVAALSSVEVSSMAHACVSLSTADVAAVVIAEATVGAVTIATAELHSVTLTESVVASCTLSVEDC